MVVQADSLTISTTAYTVGDNGALCLAGAIQQAQLLKDISPLLQSERATPIFLQTKAPKLGASYLYVA